MPLRRPSRNLRRNSRLILLAGFGGLLLLMAFAGLDAMRVFRNVQSRSDAIRRSFLTRNRLLNEIRANVYLSGTYLRDYLLEPDAVAAERHRASFERSRREIETALAGYRSVMAPAEEPPLRELNRELARYWGALEPVTAWSPAARRGRGYAFLRDEVFPRRMTMLGIADRIARVNEAQLTQSDREAAQLFASFTLRLTLTLLSTLALGLLLALFSTRRVLRLERESELARGQLKELSASVVAAQENERRSISRELHDEVGQALTGIRVGLTNLRSLVPAAATAQLDSLRSLAETTMGVVRNITLLLRPSMLDDLGLGPALQWQGREVSRTTGLAVKVAAGDMPAGLPDEYNTCVYRIVQEALNNCVRHAAATTARVTVRVESSTLLLTVEDDGRGFRPESGRGLGLLGMEERVAHLHGRFDIRSQPGSGTLLTVSLPLPATPDATIET